MVSAGAVEMLTIGEAFHRLDQEAILQRALDWLEPSGHFVTLGCYGALTGEEEWQRMAAEAVRRWAPAPGRASRSAQIPRGAEHDQRVLREAGFEAVENREFELDHEWTVDTIIAAAYSSSGDLRRTLGESASGFEEDLRTLLLSHDPRGRYRQKASCGCTAGRRPE